MMLIADMALYWDKDYFRHITDYSQNRLKFWKDSIKVWKKLTELGCEGILTPETTFEG